MEFYLNIDGNQRGPLDLAEFRELVKNKNVSQEDYVWEAKQGRWIKIKFYPELNAIFDEEATLAAAEDEGFFINVEGKTGGPFPRDAILKEIERGRFRDSHFVWDGVANRWLKASEHPVFSRFLAEGARPVTTKRYYLSKEGARFGPFDYAEVEEKILSREYGGQHYVWEPQVKKWVKLEEIPDFADVLADLSAAEPETPPPMPAEQPAPPAPKLELPAPAPSPTPPELIPRVGPAAGPPAPAEVARPGPVFGKPPGPVGAGRPAPPGAPSAPAGPPPGGGPAEPKVGDLVSISIPAPQKPPAPAEAPGKISVDEVEFRKVSGADEAVLPKAEGPKVDRSVVLDFSRPSFVRRIAAQLVDLFFISLSYFVVALLFGLLDMNPYMPGPDQYYFQQLFWGVVAGIGVFYFLVRDAGGASIGKRIMGLRVVKYDDYDRPANLVHSILRNITLLLPLLNILDIIYAFTDPKGRRVGDRFAGTILTEGTEIDYLRQHRTILDEIY
ncbi:MAG TPA: RDD family protein [bacterium]|nr:RDD family protein [bacterium]